MNRSKANCRTIADIMPDVAMATASLGQLQLGDPPESLQLDLGDGPSHMMGGASGIGVLGIQVCRIANFC